MCVHVTLFMLQCWGSLPEPPQGGGGPSLDTGATQHQLLVARAFLGGKPSAGTGRPVTGESLPRTEYLEIVRQQIRHPKTSQKAPQEFREERAVKPRKSASILSQSSSPLAAPVPSRETLKPHLRLHSRHARNPGLEVMGGSPDLSACGHTLRGAQGSARPSPISADLRRYGEVTTALSFPA